MRIAHSVLLLSGALAFAGCSGGSKDTTSTLRVRCNDGASFCIVSCDLGCSSTGCSVTEIAENQQLRFKFSDQVDVASVNNASFSIRTATGVAPSGQYEVKGNEVTFKPTVTTVNGVSSFGFVRNERYIISLGSGAQSVRNLAGDRLATTFSCSVVASRGIQDEDGAPPTVEMLVPTDLSAAPTNPTVVLRFSELIDTTPLQTALSDASPIRIVLRGQLPDGSCDADATGVALGGVPQLSTEKIGERDVTVVTWQPPVQLPGESCITVRVTGDLRDLSGRPAIPAKFQFLTLPGVSVPITLTETFASDAGQIVDVSGGTWGGPLGAGARPGLIGGDGRHGSFDPTIGIADVTAANTWIWNTSNITIPASKSLTGLAYTINDGRFYFTDFIVPDGVTVRFVGAAPATIYVRGKVQIDGRLEANGADQPSTAATSGGLIVSSFNSKGVLGQVIQGQPGSAAGCGGGRGGDGGKKCNNSGPEIVSGVPLNNGQPGQTVGVPASHAYVGSAAATGGAGAVMVPASGILPVGTPPALIGGVGYPYYSSGGGGGGFMGAGGSPSNIVFSTATQPLITEPAAAPGVAFPLLPYPASPPANYSSLIHYSVGGSGGGGGGSHPFLSQTATTGERWCAGHGGTGGGGAVVVRAGGTVVVGASAALEATGGDGVLINGQNPGTADTLPVWGASSPGGGGSGGSVLVQSARSVTVNGAVSVAGGLGSRSDQFRLVPLWLVAVPGRAGNGANGHFRFESPTGVTFSGTATPAYNAAVNSGPLNDRDDRSGDLSTWRSTNLIFPPTWQRYELDVDLFGDGTQIVTYTDSGAAGTQRAWEVDGPTTLPVQIEFQGAVIDSFGNVVEGSTGPWRAGIGPGAGDGINLDPVNGFRFSIIYNRGLYPDVVVKALRVFAQS